MKIQRCCLAFLWHAPQALGLLLLVSVLSAQVRENQPHFGVPQDWTHRHIVFNRGFAYSHPELANIEPRMLHQFARELQRTSLAQDEAGSVVAGSEPVTRDWNVSGIGASVAFGMSPAKFGFDESTASCLKDYALFGLNAVGATGGQGNLVAFNNLYSGAGGLCGAGGPSLLFSYNTSTAGGKIRTSPVLSLDGKKVAFVESGTGVSVFHVLTWSSGAGNGSSATNSAVPGVGNSAAMTSLTYDSTAGNALSSPWIDYANDIAYVGADDGILYKITGVFQGTPALAGAPWPITIGAGGVGKNLRLTAPVLDSKHIFLGDGRGNLWSIDLAAPTTTKWLAVGKYGKRNALILDAPIVDPTNETVFAISSNDGTSAVLVQADTSSLTELARARLGEGSTAGTAVNLYDGSFDNNYFNNPSTGFILVCGTGAADTTPWRYAFSFSGRILQTAPTNSTQILSSTTSRCSPMSEFFNPNIGTGGTDFFFWGMTRDCTAVGVAGGCVMSLANLSAVAPVTETNGTSVIITDNFSTAGQASSIYFTNLGSPHKAVKLTQNGLN